MTPLTTGRSLPIHGSFFLHASRIRPAGRSLDRAAERLVDIRDVLRPSRIESAPALTFIRYEYWGWIAWRFLSSLTVPYAPGTTSSEGDLQPLLAPGDVAVDLPQRLDQAPSVEVVVVGKAVRGVVGGRAGERRVLVVPLVEDPLVIRDPRSLQVRRRAEASPRTRRSDVGRAPCPRRTRRRRGSR